jgi:hypothetical protein
MDLVRIELSNVEKPLRHNASGHWGLWGHWNICRPHWDTDRTFSVEALIPSASDWKPEMWTRLQNILESEAVQLDAA